MGICVPSGITGVEQRAVQEAAEYAGARKPAYIIEEPMAAAIGAGLPVQEPTGNMIVDIGGGTTEVAVISLGGIVASQSVRVGGDELDDSIVQFIKKEYSLEVGDRTAEEVKIALGSAWPLEEELRSEEHTSALQSLMRISYAVFCLKKKKKNTKLETFHAVIQERKNTNIKKKDKLRHIIQ